MMTPYEQNAYKQLEEWQQKMQRRPSVMNAISKTLQTKVNNIIPEKVHLALTKAIKAMIEGVLYGSKYTTAAAVYNKTLEEREAAVKEKILRYAATAAAEGGVVGAGGFLLGLAEFPVLLGIKLKMLFDIAAQYGYNVKDYKERLYILHVFQLAFSSQQHRRKVYQKISAWQSSQADLPQNETAFDWRSLQQEYRDYIDLAKLAQLIPGIGAVVGFVVNRKLLEQLGETAINAYRMRWFAQPLLIKHDKAADIMHYPSAQ